MLRSRQRPCSSSLPTMCMRTQILRSRQRPRLPLRHKHVSAWWEIPCSRVTTPLKNRRLYGLGTSKGPDRQEETPHHFTPSPLFPLPGEREEGEGSWGEGSLRNGDGSGHVDSRECQTPIASPAKPGVRPEAIENDEPATRKSDRKEMEITIKTEAIAKVYVIENEIVR